MLSPIGEKLVAAAEENRLKKLKELLGARTIVVDYQDERGFSALIVASLHGNEVAVRMLLEAKATVDLQTNDGGTALYAACEQGHEVVVQMLLEAKARARDAEAFKGGMTVKEINAAFGERAGELKKPAKRLGLIDMGLIHLFMM